MEKKLEGIVYIPVAPAELIDKLTILDIKLSELTEETKLRNVRYEHKLLTKILKENIKVSSKLDKLREELQIANRSIWDSEDALRVFWTESDFGEEYVKQTTNSHKENDKRSRIKRKINELLGSKIIEEKSHQNQ